jgi:hypothetical protein
MKVAVVQYYKGFKSLQGFLAAVPFALPLLGAGAPDSDTFTEYLYPPLGDFRRLALSFTVGLLLTISYVVFAFCPLARRERRRVIAFLLVISLLGVCFLITLCALYVRRVAVPSVNQ